MYKRKIVTVGTKILCASHHKCRRIITMVANIVITPTDTYIRHNLDKHYHATCARQRLMSIPVGAVSKTTVSSGASPWFLSVIFNM